MAESIKTNPIAPRLLALLAVCSAGVSCREVEHHRHPRVHTIENMEIPDEDFHGVVALADFHLDKAVIRAETVVAGVPRATLRIISSAGNMDPCAKAEELAGAETDPLATPTILEVDLQLATGRQHYQTNQFAGRNTGIMRMDVGYIRKNGYITSPYAIRRALIDILDITDANVEIKMIVRDTLKATAAGRLVAERCPHD